MMLWPVGVPRYIAVARSTSITVDFILRRLEAF